MATLGREAIKRLVRYIVVPAPELGGDIRLRSLSASTMIELVDKFNVDVKKSNADMMKLGTAMLAMCWVDDAGEPVLAENEADHLGELPMDLLTRLCDAVYELNGLDDTKKNSPLILTGGSGSS